MAEGILSKIMAAYYEGIKNYYNAPNMLVLSDKTFWELKEASVRHHQFGTFDSDKAYYEFYGMKIVIDPSFHGEDLICVTYVPRLEELPIHKLKRAS